MNCQSLVLVFVCVASATVARAQVSVTGQESKDKSARTQQLTIETMDRSLVPMIAESKQTKVDATTTRTEATERARLNDGSYFNWRTTVSVQRQLDPNRTETVQDIVENDRQGGTRTTAQVRQETTKTTTGEQSQQSQYHRDSSGTMVLDRTIAATTRKNPDGSSSTATTEEARDVMGNLQPVQQRQATTVPLSPTKTQTDTQISQPDHLQGGFALVARETATVNTMDNTTRTERLIQQRDGAGWKDTGKVITTESRQPDGSVLRETVEQGQSAYSKMVPTPVDPLLPTRKIVEREAHKSDGTIVIQRDVLRRDVNGDWKPESFSTEAAAASQPGR